jgi:hypothetical protein
MVPGPRQYSPTAMKEGTTPGATLRAARVPLASMGVGHSL